MRIEIEADEYVMESASGKAGCVSINNIHVKVESHVASKEVVDAAAMKAVQHIKDAFCGKGA